MKKLINRCTTLAKRKGFNLNQHVTQVAMITTEVAEALEELVVPHDTDSRTRQFVDSIKSECFKFERYRADVSNKVKHVDTSQIADPKALMRELADVVIRTFTYVGGNNLTDEFIETIDEVLSYGESRDVLHGKRF